MQNIIDKKWDLNYIYDMAQQAMEAGDIEQAIKLSERGLKEAELQVDVEWKPKFEMFTNDIKANFSSRKPEMAVIIKDKNDLTKVNGVGFTHAINLKEAGYNTIDQLAKISPKILANVKGIGLTTARRFVEAAKKYLGYIHETNLDINESGSPNQSLLSKYTETDMEVDGNEEIPETKIDVEKENVYSKSELKEEDNLNQKIIKKVIDEGFHIIPQIGKEFEKIFSDIDLTIIKTIEIQNSKNILLICPIIVNLTEDNLIISEQKAKFNSLSEKNLQLDTWIEELRQIQQVLLEDITQRKHIFQYLQKYLMVEMDISESASKDVSLYTKQTQFKPYIDPIFISNCAIQFIEKSLPFAYQRRSNIHFIETNQLTRLLRFLEKKYHNIEEYSHEDSPEKGLYHAVERFQKKIRLYSIPFIGFGALVLVLALSQLGFLLQTFISLSYGILGVYAGMMGYLYYTFRVKQREIKNGFLIPHHQRAVPLDDTSLEIISQELTDELMLQFGYECFGKITTHKALAKIEQKLAENYLVEKADHDYNELFEHEKEGKSEIETEYIARFGDFLDD
ncbi:MAG: helix-hairpin-helix domain-containing protein [Candidatus Bathyarchaeota archaeon]|nr:helix-hairpin-helix domain-containing protein [Candidatus Bathyarchaeota archaeon]